MGNEIGNGLYFVTFREKTRRNATTMTVRYRQAIIKIYSLAIMLQHDGSFHDVFLHDRSDTNPGVLRKQRQRYH